jgi:hypothetical protein
MVEAGTSEKRQKRKHEAFSAAEKVWLLENADRNPKVNATDLGQALAAHVNSQRGSDQIVRDPPGKATVNDWKRHRASILKVHQGARGASSKRDRSAKYPVLENALYLWVRQQECRDQIITDRLLTAQARLFGNDPAIGVPDSFVFSHGWLAGFKQRHGIRSYVKHGEAGDANQAGVKLS